MRLLGSIIDEGKAKEFSYFLASEDIDNQCEEDEDGSFNLWVVDEDLFDQALKFFEEFQAYPTDPRFFGHTPKAPKPKEAIAPRPRRKLPYKRIMGLFTAVLLGLCVTLFIWSSLTTPRIIPGVDSKPTLTATTPAHRWMLFDYPKARSILDRLLRSFTLEELEAGEAAPVEAKILLHQLNRTPYWEGIYNEVLEHQRDPTHRWGYAGDHPRPLFEKIGEGELWRLFSPCLLHADLLHILFNVIWLIVLGGQIEQRLRFGRYFLLILLTGILPNIAQYLMSGPNFLGLSGVICGMAGFIWARQRRAPWEGYLLHRSTIIFITAWVGLFFVLSVASFVVEISGNGSLAPNIANTAHLVGGAVGYLLGTLPLFAYKAQRSLWRRNRD